MSKLLFNGPEWTTADLERITEEAERIGTEEYGLPLYRNQIEVITSEQMLDAYTSHGMPLYYNHWSFGKAFARDEALYRRGLRGLAYEIVINSDPCIAYLMEENTATMQALVIAHACVSGDTEYLSPTGWRRIDQYDGGLVAQYNEDRTANFVQPSRYIVRPQDDFIHVEADGVDQMITDDHTVPFINGPGKLIKITGAELARRQAEKTRGFNGKFISSFYMKSDTSLPYTDDQIRLLIAIKADGHIINPDVDKTHFNARPEYAVHFHLKKERKIERLRAILSSLGYIFEEKPSYDGRLVISFHYATLPDKRFGPEWFQASTEQLKVIAEEVEHWDGCVANRSYSTEFEDDAKFIQYVWASFGKHTYCAPATRAWKVVRSATAYGRSCSKHGLEGRIGPKPFERVKSEDGKAYCFTVPSHMFVMRRNGKITITGNCVGHNSVFANNAFFRQWTDASSIHEYLHYARERVAAYEEQYGIRAVERILDAAHALQYQGIDRYTRRPKRREEVEQQKKDRQRYAETSYNQLWDTLPDPAPRVDPEKEKAERIREQMNLPEDNLLYFVEQYSPRLKPWQKELVSIVRHMAQYFYPNMQTKVLNEGMASFVHYEMMTLWHQRGQITDGNLFEFLESHSGVMYQGDKSRFNPYALGYAICRDLKRMCQEPTAEDKHWFPTIAGSGDYWKVIKDAVFNYRDESFILEFLSPRVMRDFKMFEVLDKEADTFFYEIGDIHDDKGFRAVRRTLAQSYSLSQEMPDISITDVDILGDRELSVTHKVMNDRQIEENNGTEAFTMLSRLWGYPVKFIAVQQGDDDVESITFDAAVEDEEEI